MTKIIVETSCDNSPKKEFLKQINVAFATGNVQFLKESIIDNIVWNIIGDGKLEGKKSFIKKLDELQKGTISELVLDQILTHGRSGAVNGIIKMKDGNKFSFSNFYEFNGAKASKIKSITSYVIAT